MSLDDKYTYPGSGGVLRNKLSITDRATLDAAMNDYASIGWAVLKAEPIPDRLGFAYLSRIHRVMFSPLFHWAGTVRDVDTGAVGTGVIYARPAFLDANLADLFGRLARENYLADIHGREQFATALADRWGHLTAIHPFRDGNSRSQALLISQIARRAGHPIAWSHIDVDELRRRRLAAVTGNESALADYLHSAISRRAEPTVHIFTEQRRHPSSQCGAPTTKGWPCRRRGECPFHGT